MTSQTPTISWHRVQDSKDNDYEKADSKEYHQLYLNYSVTGMLEIIVQYSNSACEKLSSVVYTGEPSFTVRMQTIPHVHMYVIASLFYSS